MTTRPPAWALALIAGAAACMVVVLAPASTLASVATGLTYICSSGLVVRRAILDRTRATGKLLPLIAAGSVCYLIASLGWMVWSLLADRPLPVPSLVDAFFFAAYLMFAGFLIALGRPQASRDRRGVLDAVIVGGGLVPVAYLFLAAPLLVGNQLDRLSLTVYLFYPLFVIVLLALGIWVAFVTTRWSWPFILVMLWLSTELLGDAIYARAGVLGTFHYGQSWQALWLGSSACLGALALHPGAARLAEVVDRRRPRSRNRLLLLGAAVLIPIFTGIYAERFAHEAGGTNYVAAVVSGVLVVLVCVRLATVTEDAAEQRRLLDDLARVSADLTHQALHDPLTGLGNRRMFRDRLDFALAQRAAGGDRGAVVVLLDLVDFKTVNDTYGHDAGDQVLVEVAGRLRGVTRAGDTVCRLGGDEFAFVLGQARLDDGLRLAHRIGQVLAESAVVTTGMVSGTCRVHPRASIGIAIGLLGQDRDTLLAQADLAMYTGKERGSGEPAVFDPVLHREVLERHQLDNDLREALGRDQFHLLYQPIVELSSNKIIGVEALLRWEHPDRGLIPPQEFIPLAEASGAILGIGDWVLQEACRQLQAWDALPHTPRLSVSVNMAPRQLADPGFTARTAATLAATALDPVRVTLEITEAALGTDTTTVIQRLKELKQTGVRLAIDDFGTGYSSLSHLRQLPVDILKIDRSFVTGIAREPAEWALTTAIVRLATSLGKTTIAEGIETGGQLAHLRSLRVQYGQGYLFARPLTAAGITTLLVQPEPGGTFAFDGRRPAAPLDPPVAEPHPAPAATAPSWSSLDAGRGHARAESLRRTGALQQASFGSLQRLTALARHVACAQFAAVHLFDDVSQHRVAQVGGLELVQSPAIESMCLPIVESGLPLFVRDATTEPMYVGNRHVSGTTPVRRFAATPVRDDTGLTIGTLCVGGFDAGDLDDEQRRLLGDLAILVSEHLTLHSVVRELGYAATHDALTGLPNRALLSEKLAGTLSRRKRHAGKTGLARIDLGGITAFTDKHGHHAGDEMIAQIARRLTAAVEDEDTVARWGDTEFVVLYDALVAPGSNTLRERLETTLAEPSSFDGSRVAVRASIGFVVSHAGERGDELLSRADEAMQEQKRQHPTGGTRPASTRGFAS